MPDAAEDAADRLYGLPLEDFVRERDAAAKELRRQDRDAAAAVAALRKPVAHAWAANQALRGDPEMGEELLAAGEELRAAQDSALSGGGRDELRAATARERAAVEAIVEAAAERRTLGATALDRLRRTLHAAATDEDVRAAVAGARLIGDAEAGGAWPFALSDVPSAPARKVRAKPRDDGAERKKREEQEEQRRELRERLDAARHDRGEAERRFARAEREAARAAERLERALAEAEEARERADVTAGQRDEAERVVEHARDEVARLEEQLD